jgi:DNA-binding response OmpR family regulator
VKGVAVLQLGNVQVDLVRQSATKGKKALVLSAKEFAMLRLLAEAEGEPVTRERFLDVVWGYGAFPTTRTVDNHIMSLRAKVEANPEAPRWIKTVHGVGYRLMTNDETRMTKE